jgi:hypothetical protein
VAPTEEAVDIQRRLAESNLSTYAPGVAHSLRNLGVYLEKLGRVEDAHAARAEAERVQGGSYSAGITYLGT